MRKPLSQLPLHINGSYMSYMFSFSAGVFFHEYSRFTGQQGKEQGIYLSPVYHLHPLHSYLNINQAITAKSLPLHIASS